MKLPHAWSKATPVFDDEHLVSSAGLVPMMALAEQAGFSDLDAERVKLASNRVSTLGKGQTPVPLPAGQEFDVLGWVATAHQQARAADATLAAAVTRARQTGASWAAIGAQLALTRQGAQQRFTRASARESTKPTTHPDRHEQEDSTTTQTPE